MRKVTSIVVSSLVALVAMAGLAVAADAGTAAVATVKLDSYGLGITLVAVVLGMGIAAAGCGIAQGIGLKSACEGLARNPEAGNKLTTMLLLGLAFIESLAIYTLVIGLILIFANPFL